MRWVTMSLTMRFKFDPRRRCAAWQPCYSRVRAVRGTRARASSAAGGLSRFDAKRLFWQATVRLAVSAQTEGQLDPRLRPG